MSQFSLLAGTRNIEKSMPCVVYRFLICLGAGLGYLFASLAGAGIAIGAGSLGKNANALAPYGAALGFAAFAFLMYKLRRYWLRGVKLRQLALLAEQAQGKPIPEGKAQLEYAQKRVEENFPSAAGLHELDALIQQALAELADPPAALAPALNHPQAGRLARRVIDAYAASNHQVILARQFQADTQNAWRTAATALASYAQHARSLLAYRVYATTFEWLGFLAAFPLLAKGFEMLTNGLPVSFGYWIYLFAGVFSWALKAAFFEPIAEAAVLGVFFPLAAQAVEPGYAAELARRSPAFQAIVAKAEAA